MPRGLITRTHKSSRRVGHRCEQTGCGRRTVGIFALENKLHVPQRVVFLGVVS